MITKIQLPTQLKNLFALYHPKFDISRDEYIELLRRSVLENDYVLFVDKNDVRIYGFILAKISTLKDRKCVEVLVAFTNPELCTKELSERIIWGILVKAVLKWADENQLQDVYVLRNLRRR